MQTDFVFQCNTIWHHQKRLLKYFFLLFICVGSNNRSSAINSCILEFNADFSRQQGF